MDKDNKKIIQNKRVLMQKYKNVFSTPEGKEVLLDILKACGFHKLSYDENASHQTAFNEGARSVALRLVHTLNVDLQQYDALLNQAYAGD